MDFPTDVRDFDSDERISFSKLDSKFIAVHDDGTEYEFDAEHKRWVLADDEPIDAHDYGGRDEVPVVGDGESRKRKDGTGNGAEVRLRGRDLDPGILTRSPPSLGREFWECGANDNTPRVLNPQGPHAQARSKKRRPSPRRTRPCT